MEHGENIVTNNTGDYASNTTGGFVSNAADTRNLDNVKKIVDGRQLDEEPTAGQAPRFSENDEAVYAIRFQHDSSADGTIDVPDAKLYDRLGTEGTNHVRYGEPFTGNGFTSSRVPGERVIPESYANGVTMKPGAEMWRIGADGKQELVGVLHGREWVRIGE